MENEKSPGTELYSDQVKSLLNRTDEERFEKFKALSDHVINHLFEQASKGDNYHFTRLWLELVEGLGDKRRSKTSREKPGEIVIIDWTRTADGYAYLCPKCLAEEIQLGEENKNPRVWPGS